ncbi:MULTISPECIES: hypothetical protein [unclassified Nitrosospira]|uniref:hypothetical protein n=1 Tax=unclassified Nitrosospira TaxID=2609267 RepID=UPI000D3234B7|nr:MULTISPECIES: hypothetical protein [unclassified Nitrosospira]PTR16396.1 hypothetical protein C8R31_102410 [Nitrosospira sp. Nsp2]WON73619.1 hypothetical protein R5L00_14240 [Nitrosospira sp. Is2]
MIDVRRDGSTLLPRHERLLVLAMLCITPWMTGCAQIKSFSVAPSTVCPGETVEINWTASDKVTLNASPPLAGEGEGPAEGRRALAPERSTRFTLTVPGLLKGDQREWDVHVIPRQSDRLLGGIARCDDARFVTTSFTIEQTAMSSRARVASIANRYDRALIVIKDDIVVEIPSHGATDRFKTVPLVGAWVIRTPVAQNETCDTALDAVSGRLTIKTVMSCGESVHGDP